MQAVWRYFLQPEYSNTLRVSVHVQWSVVSGNDVLLFGSAFFNREPRVAAPHHSA